MIMDNGECYRLFSSYQIEGYISSFDIGKDQSIDDVIKLAYDNNVSFGRVVKYNDVVVVFADGFSFDCKRHDEKEKRFGDTYHYFFGFGVV